MKYIVISRKPNSQSREAQAKKLFDDIKHKTPAQIMRDDDQAVIVDSKDFSTALPKDGLIIITLSEDESKFEKVQLHNPDNGALFFAQTNPGKTIWEAPLPPRFVDQTIDVGLINCPEELQQKFDDLTEKPYVTRETNDGVQVILKLAVKTFDINSKKHCYYYFYAVDCTDALALSKVEKFENHLINLNRRQIFLFPIKHENEFVLQRAITTKQIEDFAEKHKNICSYAPAIMQMDWHEIFAALTGTRKQVSKNEIAATDTKISHRSVKAVGDGDQKVAIARQRISDLIDELNREVARNAFIRFFTDFNNTKQVKLLALRNLYNSTADINDFATFSVTVSNYVNQHPQKDEILFTTRPLTSRTATLISDITKNNGEELLKYISALQL